MTNWLTCIDCDADYKYFAVGRADGTIVLSDLETGQPQWVKRLHDGRVQCLEFNQGTLLTAGFDGMVVASDVKDGEELWRFDAGHGRVLSLVHLSDTLLTSGDDGHARLWNERSQVCVQTLDESRFGAATSVYLTPDWIAVGYQTGHVSIWKMTKTGMPYYDSGWQYDGDFQVSGKGPLYAIAASSSGKLAACARDRRVCLYETGEWGMITQLPIPAACNDLQFNPDGTLLIGACSDREVRLWDYQPMVDNPYGHWTTYPKHCGKGMNYGEQWQQEMIFSGACIAGVDRIIATSFDGSVRLFPSAGLTMFPLRTAWYNADSPSGWEESAEDLSKE
jgi:WD40 repeat protein